jgi:DNA-binding NarL/FixJ family response regulator
MAITMSTTRKKHLCIDVCAAAVSVSHKLTFDTLTIAFKAAEDAATRLPPKATPQRISRSKFKLLPNQTSVIRAGLKSGLSLGQMAKSLKLSVSTVRAAAKRLDA